MNRPWRLTVARNRVFAYFLLMLMPRPVRVGYLLRRALRAFALSEMSEKNFDRFLCWCWS